MILSRLDAMQHASQINRTQTPGVRPLKAWTQISWRMHTNTKQSIAVQEIDECIQDTPNHEKADILALKWAQDPHANPVRERAEFMLKNTNHKQDL